MPKTLNQDQVADKLAMDAKKMMRDEVELPAAEIINGRWGQVRDDIAAFSSGVWQQQGAQDSAAFAEPAKVRIMSYMDVKLRDFRNESVDILNTAKRQAFEQQFLMSHWIVDQVTPPNIKIRPKRNPKSYHPTGGFFRKIGAKEAWYDEPVQGASQIDRDTGRDVPSHERRLDGYLKTWQAAAFGGLLMGGIQGDSPGDISRRMQSTTTDNLQMQDVLSRLVKSEVQVSVADSDDTFMQDFGKIVKRRVWQTMDDERVCIICQSNNGKTEKQATHGLPAHPLCRCWWRNEVVDYSKLAGADRMPGVGPMSMVSRDPATGRPQVGIVVSFQSWTQSL